MTQKGYMQHQILVFDSFICLCIGILMGSYNEKNYLAPFWKRCLAFIIDSLIAFLPSLAIMLIFSFNQVYTVPLTYSSPLAGVYLIKDMPLEMDDYLNTFENEDGSTYTTRNVSLSASFFRSITFLSVAFFALYATFCTVIFEGMTVGKRLLRIKVVCIDQTLKLSKSLIIREFAGKVLLNTIPIIPLISVFTVIFTSNHLAIHDMIAKTKVIEY